MFAHPATHHFSRTYGAGQTSNIHHTTGRKNVNKENAGALPSKTPSRMGGKMIPSTSLRTGLGVKTIERDGNVRNVNANDGGKGKGREGEDIEPKRLFASTSGPSKVQTGIPPSTSLNSMPLISNRPTNLHRTPAPKKSLKNTTNLRTPAPAPIPPTPTPLPSATRTRRRSRHSLTPIQPQQATFQTPVPSGHRWEEEASLGSITEGLEGVDLGVGLDEVVEMDEGDDEIEYMPPPVVELPWEPAFEHPNFKELFSTLSSIPPMWSYGEDKTDLHVDELVFDHEAGGTISLCDEEDLEEPAFRRLKTTAPRPGLRPAGPSMSRGASLIRPQNGQMPRKPAPGRPSTNVVKPITSGRPPVPTSGNRLQNTVPARSTHPITPASRPLVRAGVNRPPSVPPVKSYSLDVPALEDLGVPLDEEDMAFELDFSLDDEQLTSP